MRLCFVCLGNICRSPTAAAVMRHVLDEAGLADRVAVDSAGTAAYHVGEPPDRRAVAEAARRGIPLDAVGRQLGAADLREADLVLVMDAANLADVRALGRRAGVDGLDHVRLLRSFDPAAPEGAEVPDPYYGGPEGFATVVDVVTDACRGLLGHVRAELAR